MRRAGAKEAGAADEVRYAQRYVRLDAGQEEQGLRLSLLRRIAYSGGNGVCGTAETQRRAAEQNFSADDGVRAEDGLGGLRAACADQTRHTHDLPRLDREVP